MLQRGQVEMEFKKTLLYLSSFIPSIPNPIEVVFNTLKVVVQTQYFYVRFVAYIFNCQVVTVKVIIFDQL